MGNSLWDEIRVKIVPPSLNIFNSECIIAERAMSREKNTFEILLSAYILQSSAVL